jgi:hypothetical protein
VNHHQINSNLIIIILTVNSIKNSKISYQKNKKKHKKKANKRHVVDQETDMPFSEDINNQETASFRPSAIFLLQ